MSRINHRKNIKAMTGLRVLSYFILAMGLLSCASFPSPLPTTHLSSAPVQAITDEFRLMPQRFERGQDKVDWLKEVNEFYPDGFLKVSFTTEENLEKIILDKVYIGFSYHLNLCEGGVKAGLPIYGSEIFRSTSQLLNADGPYYIFIPRNLKAAVSSTIGATETLASGSMTLPSDLEALCVTIGARKSLGGKIEVNLGSVRHLHSLNKLAASAG